MEPDCRPTRLAAAVFSRSAFVFTALTTWGEHYCVLLLISLNQDSVILKLQCTWWGFYCWIKSFMAIVVKKTIQSSSNYPVSKRITKISLVFAAWPQATWRQHKVDGGVHIQMSFPARRWGGGGGPSGLQGWTKELKLTLVTQWAMCPTAWITKAVSQVILHMLLSGFFNTCSFCFCHPALHGDINLRLADSQAQVSAYSSEHIRTLDFPKGICLFFSCQALGQTFVTFFFLLWLKHLFFSSLNSFNCLNEQQ